jgi:hypothetical protein
MKSNKPIYELMGNYHSCKGEIVTNTSPGKEKLANHTSI